MKTRIIILVEADNNNIVYRDVVSVVKKEIISYFGIRNARSLSPADPSIAVDTTVTQEDVDALYKVIDSSFITLLVLNAWDTTVRVMDNIIDLS